MFNKFKNICGIYKINFNNGKSYIGLSANVQKRLIQHLKANDNLPVHKAIKKYGLIDENIEILESFNTIDRKKLQEREIYWIQYYDTFNAGYNLTFGGDGASEGIHNVSAKLTQQQLDNLFTELIENKILIKDLAFKYNLSAEAISDINQGKRYYNNNYNYPLRPDTRFTSEQMKGINGVNKPSSKFNQEQINEIITLLQENKLSFLEISEKFNCCENTISNINNGYHYPNPKLQYPIRKQKKNPSRISLEQLELIFELLKNTKMTYTEIGKQLGLSCATISRINSGKYHNQNNMTYPIRKK